MKRRRRKAITNRRVSFWEATGNMSEKQFKNCYRLSKKSFRKFLSEVRPYVSSFEKHESEEECKAHMAGCQIEVVVKLAIFLRILAGASQWEPALAYGVGKSTVAFTFRTIVKVMLLILPMQDLLHSNDMAGFKTASLRFLQSRAN